MQNMRSAGRKEKRKMMKAHVKGEREQYNYTIENVVSVTYTQGKLYLVYEDEGDLNSMSFSIRSLEKGGVVIS